MTYAQWLVVVGLSLLVGRLIDLLYERRLTRLEDQHYRDVVHPNLRAHEDAKAANRSAKWHG